MTCYRTLELVEDVVDTDETRSSACFSSLRLLPFSQEFRAVVARWAPTPEEVFLLAPSTEYPLTAGKVAAWEKPGGRAFLLARDESGGGESELLGYAELNPMRRDPRHLWLGHVLIRPDRRGLGLGAPFVRRLLAIAWNKLHAKKVSLIVFPENTVAIRCYKRTGFLLGKYEHHSFKHRSERGRLLRMEINPPPSIPTP